MKSSHSSFHPKPHKSNLLLFWKFVGDSISTKNYIKKKKKTVNYWLNYCKSYKCTYYIDYSKGICRKLYLNQFVHEGKVIGGRNISKRPHAPKIPENILYLRFSQCLFTFIFLLSYIIKTDFFMKGF